MWKGSLVSINIARSGSGPMETIDNVRAVPGSGLEGDRYFSRTGSYSVKHGPDREVTLIELEAIQALEREQGLLFDAKDARRNLVTRGAPLNHLVGKEFKVGDVTLRGLRLCEPCSHLAGLTRPEVTPALIHRGGLRAQIVTEGIIRVGDSVEEI